MRIVTIGLGLALFAHLAQGAEQYQAPEGASVSAPTQFSPVIRQEEWEDGERRGRIQVHPPLKPEFSFSEEMQSRPVLDLRRTPSSESLGEQPPQLMIGNEWEIFWQEKEEPIKPQRWKYE